MADTFVKSPMDLPATPPEGYRGGPGTYDGERGYPGRTPSPNAVPEKTLDSPPGAPAPTKG